MRAMVPGDPVDTPPGAAPVQLCDASVTGVLAAGIPAPPAQLGGTDSGPIDEPPPAAASTGAAPTPPAPPTAPARLGGPDAGPSDDPPPAAASTGAAPTPPAPPTAPAGPTSEARALPSPPM